MAFDVITPTKLVNQELPLTVGTLHTVDNDSRDIVKDINIANNNASPVNVTLYLVDSGDTAGNSNALLPTIKLRANSVFQWFGSQVIDEGDTIQGLSDTANVSIKISGGTAT